MKNNKFLFGLLIIGFLSCRNQETKEDPVGQINEIPTEITKIEREDIPSENAIDTIVSDDLTEALEPEVEEVENAIEEPEVKVENTFEEPEAKVKSPAKKVVKVKLVPNIKFKNRVYDYGEITEGDVIRHNFSFENIGNGPLEVNKTDVSCGCTVPSYPFLAVMPGDTSFIGSTYNSVGKSGVQEASIDVYTNTTKEPIKLYLKGYVKPKVVKKDSI